MRPEFEDGRSVTPGGSPEYTHTFADAGDHKVKIAFKSDVTDFTGCFFNCTSLTSIPAGLSDNCTNVTGFCPCFDNWNNARHKRDRIVAKGRKGGVSGFSLRLGMFQKLHKAQQLFFNTG